MFPLQILKLESGQVSYRKLGQGKRKIIFYHGFPGSSSQIEIFQNMVDTLDLEVLCFDRPGYNQTTIGVGRGDSLPVCNQIATSLMRSLDWKTCEVVTVSGGTPAGLSLAMAHPECVQCVHVISGLGAITHHKLRPHFPRFSRFTLQLLPWIPGGWLQKVLGFDAQTGTSNSEHPLMQFLFPGSQADRELLNQQTVQKSLRLGLFEALQQKGLGPQMDAKSFVSNWGKMIHQIQVPVYFWHGEDDRIIPHQIALEMSQLISKAEFELIQNEGHFSLPVRKLAEILKPRR